MHFRNGSSKVPALDLRDLSRFVAVVRRMERLDHQSRYSLEPVKPYRYRVTGYSDWSGPLAANSSLAGRRAEAVRRRLIQLGLPAAKIAIATTTGERGASVAIIAFGPPGGMCGGG